MFSLALAAVAVATPAKVDPEVAEITQLEERWGQAFVTRDFGFIERIVAPEYRLVVADPDGKYSITQRAEWIKNGQTFIASNHRRAARPQSRFARCLSLASKGSVATILIGRQSWLEPAKARA